MSASIGDTSNKTDDIVIEPCLEINQLDAITVRASFNGLLKDAPRNVSTSIVNGLSQQLIYQLNLLVPNALLSCDDFNIDVGDAAYPCLQPLAKQTLQKAIQARGVKLIINSSYRTIAQQMLLYLKNRYR